MDSLFVCVIVSEEEIKRRGGGVDRIKATASAAASERRPKRVHE